MSKRFKFVDLFAGLGGFHLAAEALGGECVFASELKLTLRENYLVNFGTYPAGDISKIDPSSIPSHDLLCAGFPCQPFSKAGGQKGWKDTTRGTLFFVIAQILELKKPQYVILENVANFFKHDGGNTYAQVLSTLKELGYEVKSEKLSPHRYGVPQHRDRMYIVASLKGLEGFKWPEPTDEVTHISDVLEQEPTLGKLLPDRVVECLGVWQDFIEALPASISIPYYPIWSMEFGATYPIDKPIEKYKVKDLWGFKGSFGVSLNGMSREQIKAALPSHALRSVGFPKWKVSFIERNRNFYEAHKEHLVGWLDRIKVFHSSLQKLEWNYKEGERNVWSHLVQVRASGLRIKKPDFSPALVAASDSQIPIVAWKKRYLSVRECARLQSMNDLKLPESMYDAYEALGNAVNVKLVKLIIGNLIELDELVSLGSLSSIPMVERRSKVFHSIADTIEHVKGLEQR